MISSALDVQADDQILLLVTCLDGDTERLVVAARRLREGETEVINEQIASKENISEIQKALYHVVSEGLAKPAGTHLVEVAGKTGTAQVRSMYDSFESQSSEYHVSFCGYFPAFAPKYSMIISLNKMGLPASGGAMAGAVFHDVVEWMVLHGWLDKEQ